MKYYVFDYESPDDAEEFSSAFKWGEGHEEIIAQDAAEIFHERGGWEVTWPVEIAILNDDGKELGRFEVEREFVPTFSAEEI